MYPLETEFWCSSLDISRGEALYSWLEGLLTELTDLLPSTLFHIGATNDLLDRPDGLIVFSSLLL